MEGGTIKREEELNPKKKKWMFPQQSLRWEEKRRNCFFLSKIRDHFSHQIVLPQVELQNGVLHGSEYKTNVFRI